MATEWFHPRVRRKAEPVKHRCFSLQIFRSTSRRSGSLSLTGLAVLAVGSMFLAAITSSIDFTTNTLTLRDIEKIHDQRQVLIIQAVHVLVEADQLWNAGKQTAAAADYLQVVQSALNDRLDTETRSRLLSRILDVAVEHHDDAAIKECTRTAYLSDITLSPSSRAAIEVVAESKKYYERCCTEYNRQEAKRQAEELAEQNAMNRAEITSTLRFSSFKTLTQTYGDPQIHWQSADRPSLHIYAWKLGKKADDTWLAMAIFNQPGSIDGYDVVEPPTCMKKSELNDFRLDVEDMD